LPALFQDSLAYMGTGYEEDREVESQYPGPRSRTPSMSINAKAAWAGT
jgi:hypothetical protein